LKLTKIISVISATADMTKAGFRRQNSISHWRMNLKILLAVY